MNLYDEHYSAYFNAPDDKYPCGSAVDSTSEDRLDGTPYLAAFFNDVVGFFQAVFFGVFGNPKIPGEAVTRSPSNSPENARASDVWDAIKKFVGDRVDEIRAMIGVAGGIAPLDSSGKVPASHLPSYVDDVLEYPSAQDFPAEGEEGKIYVAKDTDKEYRWGGTVYAELSKYDVMVGASAASDGGSGLVPAPRAGEQDMILTGAGVWKAPSALLDVIIPVGSPYVQYPLFPAPTELWPGTVWEIVDYGGAFFRAAGGNASAFVEAGGNLRMQAGQNLSHTHGMGSHKHTGTTGGMNRNASHNHVFFANDYGGGGTKFLSFQAGGDSLSRFDSHSWNLEEAVAYANTDHEHTFTTDAATGSTGSSGGTENRPDNYTKRIWRRVG